MRFDFVIVVCERQWSYSVDATSNSGMIISESFYNNSGKPKKMNATKKHRRRQRLLLNIP